MKQTTDYEMFKKHPKNRDLDEFTVTKLQRSISIKNLLEFRPIMVNSKMEIIDGQHRLEAAKRLGVPVFYQIEPDAEANDILILNTNQKCWTQVNYLEFFAKEGKQHYIDLYRFMKNHNLTLSMSLAFLNQDSGNGSKFHGISPFLLGEYKFPPPIKIFSVEIKIQKVMEFKQYVRERISGNKKFLESSKLTRAICTLANHADFDFNILIQKVPYTLNIIGPRSGYTQYIEMLGQIYNWKNKKPLGSLFIEEGE